MSKFKVGDKVIFRTLKTGTVYDQNWKLASLEEVYTVEFIGKYPFKKNSVEEAVVLEGIKSRYGTYGGFVPVSILEKSLFDTFVKPKYKVGQKFVNGNNWVMEIVKSSLNKKKGEYYYMLFDANDGYGMVESESSLSRMERFNKPKEVEEMTLAQVCKKLGKNIKIIK